MAKHPDVHLVFVQSGPTEWDEAGRLQGRNDLPLSASAQASLLSLLDDVTEAVSGPVRVVLTSSDEASHRTAKEIAGELGAKVRVIEDLAGIECGLWEGRLESELAERSPKAYRQWRQDPSTASPPEGESVADARHRVMTALSKALEKTQSNPAVVVLRPGPLGLIRGTLEGRPLSSLWETIEETPRVWSVTAPRAELKGLSQELDASA